MIYCLYEHVERTRVEQLIAKNDFDDVVKKQLKNYLKKYDRSQKGFKVEYETQGLMIGRKYAKGSLSLQNFKKDIRETLVYDTHTDVDIVNCHVVLLSQYCEKQGLRCKCLDDYVSNRNVRLQEIIDTFKTTRKVAKDLFLVMMYGGIVNEYCCQNGFDINIDMPQWVNDLEQELKLLTDRISNIETTIFNDVKKLKKKEYQNRKSSCLSYTLQVIEDNVIHSASTKLKQLGYCVDTLCFDGMLVRHTNMSSDVLEELSSYCFESTGYKVEFSFKPMEKHYDFEPEHYDFTNYEFEYLDEYNQRYCASLEGETSEEKYHKRKAYIEYFLCKVQQPEPLFIFQNGVHKTPHILNPSQLANLLKPIQSGFMSQMGGVIPFADKWTNDVNHRLYRAMDFIPYNENNPIHDNNMFNLFEGFNPDIYGPEMDSDTITKKITPYLDLVRELCGGADDMYLHKFFAQIFQDPSNRVPICVILKGKQGVGKNVLLNAIGNMLNKSHYNSSSKPTDFFGDHAEGAYRKLLVNLDECELKDTFDLEGKMKGFVSEPTININPKNVRPFVVQNHARSVITTNKPNPMPLDVKTKERRYVVYMATDVYIKKSSNFWCKLVEHLHKPETMSALYQWYMSFDLKYFDWIKQRPITKAYKEMCNLYSPVEALFFEEFVDLRQWIGLGIAVTEDTEITITLTDLFKMYEQFLKKHRFLKDETKATSSRAFVSKMHELELPVTKYKSHNHMISYKFVPKEVYDFCEMKRWINSYKYEEEESEIAYHGEDADEDYFI